MDHSEILLSLRKISRSINLESKRIQKLYDVSIPQLLSLHYLNREENKIASLTAIKSHLNLNASTVTGITGRLEQKGLIKRMPKEYGDKRITYIALTPKGKELLKTSPMLLHERLSINLSKLSPEEASNVLNSLQTIVDLMELDDSYSDTVLEQSFE